MTKKQRFVELCKLSISRLTYDEGYIAMLLDTCLMYPDELLPDDVPLRHHAADLLRCLHDGGNWEVKGRPEMTKWVTEFSAKHGLRTY